MSFIRPLKVQPKNSGDDFPTDANARVFRVRLKYNMFSTAATTANLDTLTLPTPNIWTSFPGGLIVEDVRIGLITVFAGGSISACTLSVGTTGSATAYLGATNVFTGATAAGNVTPGAGASLNAMLSGNATPNGVGTVRVQLVTTTANANALTSGVVDLYMRLRAISTRTV